MEQVDLERLRPFIREDPCFYAQPGREHYQLLAHLSTTFSGKTIFDIGTHRGDSAIALSYNKSNTVESFDIADAVPPLRRMRENVHYHVEDLFDPEHRAIWKPRLLESPLIFIDIDPHEGTREFELVSWLKENRYQGTILLDDIWYFKGMRDKLWSQIEGRHKTDLTERGHWSGTGIVSFEELDTKPTTTNWTVVTGYFDLTNRDDATDEIRARDSAHYIEANAAGTLGLDQNLVIFCDRASKDRILKLRPKHLRSKTVVVEMEFDEFPLSKYYDELKKTRDGHGRCARDPRNTASYYLFCVARFAMMKKAIELNSFHSTHYAWANICLERMGWANLAGFERALATQRSRFSTAYIDYLPKQTFRSLETFYGKDGCRDPNGPCGRCSMCSGFFTGDLGHMREVSNLIEKKFVECLRAGYGHADEQLIALVHHEYSALFEWYPADYAQMVTNYAGVIENAEGAIQNLVRKSFAAQDWPVCLRACKRVWRAYADGRCQISDVDLAFLLAAKSVADTRLAVL